MYTRQKHERQENNKRLKIQQTKKQRWKTHRCLTSKSLETSSSHLAGGGSVSSATGDRLRLGMPTGTDVASDLAAAAAGLSGVWISLVGEGNACVEVTENTKAGRGVGKANAAGQINISVRPRTTGAFNSNMRQKGSALSYTDASPQRKLPYK